jgi:hypothetical protein
VLHSRQRLNNIPKSVVKQRTAEGECADLRNAAGENLVTKMHAAKVKITMNASENIIGHEILLRNKSDRSLENFK